MVTLRINGKAHTADVPSDMPLLWVLRDVIGLTGTKFGCGIAQCGACTVHLDGQAVRSCVLPVGSSGKQGDHDDRSHRRDPHWAKKSKQAWLETEVVQCGYCSRAKSWRRPLC